MNIFNIHIWFSLQKSKELKMRLSLAVVGVLGIFSCRPVSAKNVLDLLRPLSNYKQVFQQFTLRYLSSTPDFQLLVWRLKKRFTTKSGEALMCDYLCGAKRRGDNAFLCAKRPLQKTFFSRLSTITVNSLRAYCSYSFVNLDSLVMGNLQLQIVTGYPIKK